MDASDDVGVRDKDLYSQILGIREPWRVERVDLDLGSGEVNVYPAHDVGAQWPFSECGAFCPLYYHQPLRRWRHLDTRQLRTILNAGKIVFDKFHIAKRLSEAVDQVRRRENKQLRAQGDDRLTGTRYDWLRQPARMEPGDRKQFAALRHSNLKTARAWALKHAMMAFFEYIY